MVVPFPITYNEIFHAFTSVKPHMHILPSPDRLCCSGAGDRRCRSLPGMRMDSRFRAVPDQSRYIRRFLSQNGSTHSTHCADHRGRLRKCASQRSAAECPCRLLNVISSLPLCNSGNRQSVPLQSAGHSSGGTDLFQCRPDG